MTETEELLEISFDLNPLMMAIARAENGVWVQVNQSMIHTLGYEKEEFIGHNSAEIGVTMEPPSRSGVIKEIQAKTKDGRILDLLGTTYEIALNHQPCIVAEYIDITERKKAEDNIRHLAAIVESSNDAIIGIDLSGVVTNWNEAATRIYGYSSNDMIGTPISRIIPHERISEEIEAFTQLTAGEKVRHFETQRIAKDGRIVEVSVTVSPIKGASGKVIGASKITRDITERKKVDQKLADSLELFTSCFELTPAVMGISQMSDGVYIRVNKRYEQLLGYSSEEVIGSNNIELKLFADENERSVIANSLLEKGFIRDYETRLRTKSGTEITLLLSAVRITLSDIPCLLSVGYDISERKAFERELQESKDLFAKAFELSPSMMSITRVSDLIYININASFERGLGYRRDEIVGKKSSDLTLAVRSDERIALANSIHTTGLYNDFEIQLRKKNGDIADILGSAQIVEFNNEPCILSVFFDITERKLTKKALELSNETLRDRTKEAEQASLAKTYFLSNMSHEIRTPMNAILGFLQLLQRSDLSIKQKDYVDKAELASKTLLGILNDILDFSKVEAGKMELERVPFEIRDLLNGLSVILSSAIQDKDVKILFVVGPDVPLEVIGDTLRMQQVLLNLAGNAIKFTEQGEIKISIKVHSIEKDTITINFSIEDTGIGIPEEILPTIFDGFVQAQASTARKYGGSGLGLAISQSIVQLMGGTIEVESTVGKGSIFSFSVGFGRSKDRASIPNAVVTETITQSIIFDTVSSPTDGKSSFVNITTREKLNGRLLAGLHVLVVDDNKLNQAIVQELLQPEGAQVTLASSGQVAIDMIAKGKNVFDAILLDVQMPGMDGYEVTKFVRIELGLFELPIIAITANVWTSERQKCLEAGMNDHVGKPFDIGELVRTILKHTKYSKNGNSPLLSVAQKDPETADFDFEKVMRRLGGNVDLFSSIVESFSVSKADLVNRLRSYLIINDMEKFKLELHNLKGFSATAGALSISRFVENIESGLTKESVLIVDEVAFSVKLQTLLDEASKKLEEELDRLRKLLKPQAEKTNSPEPIEWNLLFDNLDQLEEYLQTSNAGALNAFARMEPTLALVSPKHILNLGLRINSLDFEEALQYCKIIRDDLKK